MALNWKTGRWICIIIAALNIAFLLGLSSAVGFNLSDEFAGFQIQTLLGLANIFAVYILYKVL